MVLFAVMAVGAIWSNNRQVLPLSVLRKMPTCAAADVAADLTTISRIRVPVVAPVLRVVIVPVPSRAVLADEMLTVSIRGVAMN